MGFFELLGGYRNVISTHNCTLIVYSTSYRTVHQARVHPLPPYHNFSI